MTRFGKFVSILATGAVAVGLLQSPASAAVVGGNRIVTGPGNTSSFVKLFDPSTLAMNGFTAYPGGLMDVRVAAGDLTGDGVADIATAPGPGGSANVKVFDGVSGAMIRSFFAYVNYNGGVNIALGDVTGDGKADIITGTDGSSAAHVKVFDATNNAEIRSFLPYAGYLGSVRVAAGDMNGDGKADIITGTGAGAAPHVKVFDATNNAELSSFFAYDWKYTGGVFVAAGDIDGDGKPELITSQGSGPGEVRAFTQKLQMIRSFLPYAGYVGGVRVAAGNLVGDKRAEIVTGPAAASANVKVFNPDLTTQSSFIAYPGTPTKGVYVAVANVRSRQVVRMPTPTAQ